MEDFFKQFRENMERRPKPDFEEKDWLRLQSRLAREEEKQSPAAFAWWWLLLPLVLLLAGSNTFLYFELKKANQKAPNLEWRRDTVFRTTVVYRTDTVHITRVVREWLRLPVIASARQNPNPDLWMQKDTGSRHPGTLIATQKVTTAKHPPSGPDTSDFMPFTGMASFKFRNDGSQSVLLPTCFPDSVVRKSVPGTTLPETAEVPPANRRKKTFRHHVYAMRPKGVQAGVAGGRAYPVNEGAGRQSGFAAGAQVLVGFSPNLRLWLDAMYFNMRFEADRMDPAIGVPLIDVPFDDFTFVKAEVPRPSLHYSAGMQYLFRADKKFKPLIGLGYGAVSLLPYEVVYEFKNEMLGVDWVTDKRINRRSLQTGLLVLQAGMEHDFSRHWQWHWLATYRSHLGENDVQSPDMFGVQAGLLYRF